MAYKDANGNWQAGSGQTLGGLIQSPASSAWRRAVLGGSGRDSLRDMAYGTSPEESAYYGDLQGQALRGISASYAPQRSFALQVLESRGLGRSSEVGRTLGSLGAAQGLASQGAISDIRGQQFSARQQRINAYMNYLYQKQLQKDAKKGHGGVLGFLENIGGALPYVGDLFGGGGNDGGNYNIGIDASPTPGGSGLPDLPYRQPPVWY